MELLTNITQAILNVGSVAALPIVITILGLVFKMEFFKAVKSGLLMGIGFQGLKLVISLLTTTITPITGYYATMNSGFTIIDVGWQALSAVAWMSPFAAFVIPVGLILNFFLIKGKFVKTLNIDIWNYWHILMSAAIMYYILGLLGITGIAAFAISFIYAMGIVVLICVVGDKLAPFWQKYFGYEGTTCTTKSAILSVLPIAFVIDKIIDKIPGINNVNISLSWINKKFGAIGDPAIIGFFVGALLAVITKQTVTVIIQTAIGISAVIVLMPRMVTLLMEGLAPISKAGKTFVTERISEDQEILIGCDSAFSLGDQGAITLSLILMPITILLAFIIPGNSYFPVGILASIPYYAGITIMISDGNLFRGIITGTIFMALLVVCMNFMAGIATAFVATGGSVIDIPAESQVTAASIVNIVDVVVYGVSKLFGIL